MAPYNKTNLSQIKLGGKLFKYPLITWCLLIGLVWFYGISTIVGYLMPNPVFTYISNIWFLNTFCRYRHLEDQKALFLTTQFSINHLSELSLNIKQLLLTHRSDLIWWYHSRPEYTRNGNEGLLRIPQSSNITGASYQDICWVFPLGRDAAFLGANLIELDYIVTSGIKETLIKIERWLFNDH